MYSRGDWVWVRGADGREAALIVWEVRRKGLLLCTQMGFQQLLQGKEAPVIGFPMHDILGHTEAQSKAA